MINWVNGLVLLTLVDVLPSILIPLNKIRRDVGFGNKENRQVAGGFCIFQRKGLSINIESVFPISLHRLELYFGLLAFLLDQPLLLLPFYLTKLIFELQVLSLQNLAPGKGNGHVSLFLLFHLFSDEGAVLFFLIHSKVWLVASYLAFLAFV